jgi:uncharacterized protein YcsI (UPF0317 family)
MSDLLESTVLRQRVRSGEFTAPTSGLAPGYVQCNVVIVPERFAADFARFCERNPKPCPLLAQSPKPGDPTLPTLGADIDIRRDVPRYRRWVNGQCETELIDLTSEWREDHVAFALGCSFSFEEALLEANIEIRNISEGVNVPMYRTTRFCEAAGPFQSNLVVSMRPMTRANADRATAICRRYPAVHGAPVHIGNPEALGISDLNRPDFGDAVTIKADEVPVFWACGVTPQVALENAQLPLAYTHSPGHMLVTDLLNTDLAEGS